MSATACPVWCSAHVTDVSDEHMPTPTVTEIHQTHITRGEVTVTLEASPSWVDDPHYLPLVLPEITAVDAASARDYAAALIEAARLLDSTGEHV